MSKDWVRISGAFYVDVPNGLPDTLYEYGQKQRCFVPLSLMSHIRRIDNVDEMTLFSGQRYAKITDKIKAEVDAVSWGNLILNIQRMDGIELFPIYFAFTLDAHVIFPRSESSSKGFWCIIHPDEKTRMERYLNGTSNPMHDLVNELRYNPHVEAAPAKEQGKKDFLISLARKNE